MLRDAHSAGGLPFPFSAPHAAALFSAQLCSTDRLCLLSAQDDGPHGVLMASAQDHPFAAIRYAAEVVWWIDPDHRGGTASEMLAAYEAWAVSRNCTFASMAALEAAPRAGAIYRRRGYQPVETHFLKSLAPIAAA
jgi:GNAT superfamily N-acetyltransferase